MRGCRVWIAAAMLTVWSSVAFAQEPRSGQRRVDAARRVQEGIERLVVRRLRLDDAQLRQLRAANAQFGPRRDELWRRERTTRVAIRRALAQGDTAATGPLPSLIDDLLAVQRRRLDLVAEEQRALAAFLSPVQRTRYLALQEQLRQRIDGMRGGQGRGSARARRGGPNGVAAPN